MVIWPAEGGPLKGQRHTQLAGAPDGVLRAQGKHRLPQSRHRPGRIVPRVPRAVLQPGDALGSIAPQPPLVRRRRDPVALVQPAPVRPPWPGQRRRVGSRVAYPALRNWRTPVIRLTTGRVNQVPCTDSS